MHPAFSVIFLTTLIGVGQGLFIALYSGQSYGALGLLPIQSNVFYTVGSVIAAGFLIAGLAASFFHLGHPERAWRSAAMWRTSWLSREVIVLPLLIGTVLVYGLVHYLGWDLSSFGITTGLTDDLSLLVGTGGVVFAFALFLCTGMIYACIKFLQEWASPLTVINYTLFGLCSGFLLATAFASIFAPELTTFYGVWTLIITLAALSTNVHFDKGLSRIGYPPQSIVFLRTAQTASVTSVIVLLLTIAGWPSEPGPFLYAISPIAVLISGLLAMLHSFLFPMQMVLVSKPTGTPDSVAPNPEQASTRHTDL
jgi:DMSO reductase anchor subunit